MRALQQPTPFQRFSAKVSTMRTPSNFQKTWWLCVWFWFLEGHKEGTMTKLFPLVWKIDPVSPKKSTPPQLPHDLPHSIFVRVRVWVHAGHGVVRHYQRFWPAKRVSMVVPNAPRLTVLPPKVVNTGFSGFQLCWFFPSSQTQHKLK